MLKRHLSNPLITPKTAPPFSPHIVFNNGIIRRDKDSLIINYPACDETVCLVESTINHLLHSLKKAGQK
jgi:predicted GH43/DUF377 family glycosyl hydrolase